MQSVWSLSWQDRCSLGDDGTREQAEDYWKLNGFTDEHISWGDDNSLIVSNVTTGFTPPTGSGVGASHPGGYSAFSTSEEVAQSLGLEFSNSNSKSDSNAASEGRDWFNIVNNILPGFALTHDGAEIPQELLQMHDQAAWHKNYAFRLQAGDLLWLDNLRVQHGRLPYTNDEGPKRKVVTLLYK